MSGCNRNCGRAASFSGDGCGCSFTRQSSLLHDRLPPPPARLLWLSPSCNSIGDSLMELAGRALLGAYEVDLLTDKYYAELYRKDRYLGAGSFQTPRRLSRLATILAYRTCSTPARSASNAACAPTCPSLRCRGSFGGPIITACCSVVIASITSWATPTRRQSCDRFCDHASSWRMSRRPCRENGRRRVALAVGGKFPARTYGKWPEMLRSLITSWPAELSFPEFVMVGSPNGLADLPAA